MGAKVAMTYVILCSVSALGQFISLFCRWHMVSIGGGFILTMYTTLFTTRFDHGVTTLCTLMTKWEKCRDIKKGMWLQDVQSQTCMPALTALSNVPCHAFKTAYIMGMISVLAFVFNWILMLASCGMLWQYLRGKHKPEYRNISFYLIIAGAILLFIAVMCWSFMALPALDEVSHLFTFIGQPPAGASYGYFWMWFSFIFELVAIALHAWMPLNNEMTEEERLQQQMQKEYNQHAASQGMRGEIRDLLEDRVRISLLSAPKLVEVSVNDVREDDYTMQIESDHLRGATYRAGPRTPSAAPMPAPKVKKSAEQEIADGIDKVPMPTDDQAWDPLWLELGSGDTSAPITPALSIVSTSRRRRKTRLDANLMAETEAVAAA